MRQFTNSTQTPRGRTKDQDKAGGVWAAANFHSIFLCVEDRNIKHCIASTYLVLNVVHHFGSVWTGNWQESWKIWTCCHRAASMGQGGMEWMDRNGMMTTRRRRTTSGVANEHERSPKIYPKRTARTANDEWRARFSNRVEGCVRNDRVGFLLVFGKTQRNRADSTNNLLKFLRNF